MAPRQRRVCLFCDRPADSYEHYFPQWYMDWLKRQGAILNRRRIHKRDEIRELDGRRTLVVIETKQNSDPRYGKIKCVCATCNDGWMSRIQEKAKPIILNITTGGVMSLNVEEQLILSVWAVMFSMTLECRHPDWAFSRQADRLAFRDSQLPPGGWWVGIERYAGGRITGFNHFGLLEAAIEDGGAREGMQASTWVIGGLVFHTVYATPGVPPPVPLCPSSLVQIWPQRRLAVPLGAALSDLRVDAISRETLGLAAEGRRRMWDNA